MMGAGSGGVAGDLVKTAARSVAGAGEAHDAPLRNNQSRGQRDAAFSSLAARHRWTVRVIEQEVMHTPAIGLREGPCPVCGVGTMRIRRDGIHYTAICERGCGLASVLR